MNTTGFATIGTSKITQKFLSAAKDCKGFKLVAVYSRDIKKAEKFAREQGAEKYYDSLDALAADKDVEAVYVASPNHMHYEHVMKLLKAGKHVLCEKAIASNYVEAEEMFRTAKEQGVILLEAMRTVFHPGMSVVRENLPKLGAIRKAAFNYCQYSSRYDSFKEGQEHNIFRRECSAGALMDIGVYSVHSMLYLLGMPETITGFSVMLRGDIDGAGNILAKYPDKIAEVSYSKITDSSIPDEIQGENGTLLFGGDSNSPENVRIIYRDGREEILWQQETKNSMKYELEHLLKIICGDEEAQPHTERSLNAMKLMDEMRRQCGIIFPADERARVSNE